MFKWFAIAFILVLTLGTCKANPPQSVQSTPISTPMPNIATVSAVNSIDNNIRQLRTGDLTIKVVNSNQQPVVGAVVKLEQTKHNFEFGTALATHMFANNVNSQEQSQYLQLAKQLFNASVHENALKWYETEPQRGRVSYANADRILNWSVSQGMPMRGHTLFWEREQYNQPWLKSLKGEELRQAVKNRTTEVCSRYRDRMDEYDVLNEMLHGNFFQSRLGPNIVKEMFTWCKQADPSAVLYVNDYDILNGKALNRYVALIRSLIQQGVPVGGIGIQAHIREPTTTTQVQQVLDTLAQFGLPIKITEFGAIAPNETEKARILADVYRAAFAHPAVKGIYMWGFWPGANWEPKASIYTKNWQPLPAAQAYQDLLYKQWWTNLNTVTDATGNVNIRGFFGDYRLSVTTANRQFVQNFSFPSGQQQPQVITVVARSS